MKRNHLLLFFGKVLPAVVCLFAHCTVQASDVDKDCKVERFTYKNGLADNLVHDLCTDSDGYVWIATEKGLSRYDGKNIVNFDASTNPFFFQNPAVHKLVRKGVELYLLSARDGVIAFNTRMLTCRKVNAKGTVNLLTSGDTIVYYYSDGLMELQVGGKIKAKRQFDIQGRCSMLIRHGRLLMSMENHPLTELSLANLETVNILGPKQENIFCHLEIANNQHVYFISRAGLMQLAPNDSISLVVAHQGKLNITSFSFNPVAGLNYIVAHHSFYLNKEGKNILCGNIENGNAELRCILPLDEETFIIGTNQGFTHMIKTNENARFLDDSPSYVDRVIRVRRAIIPYGDELYLLGFPGLIIYKTKQKTFINLDSLGISTNDGLILGNDLYFLGEGRGLRKMNLKTHAWVSMQNRDLKPEESYFAIAIMPDKCLMIGGIGKLVVKNPSSSDSRSLSLPKDEIVYSIAPTQVFSGIFFGTNKGFYQLDGVAYQQQHRLVAKKMLTDIVVRDILVDSLQHQVWLATEKGVMRLDFDASFTKLIKKNDLSNSKFEKTATLLDDHRGWIWASTFRGLKCINKKSLQILSLQDGHGLTNEEYNYKSAALLPDGSLMFGGLNGYDIINPVILDRKAEHRSLRIAGYSKTSNVSMVFSPALSDTIEFRRNTEDLTIFLSALDFSKEDGYAFSYQLDERPWVDLKNTNFLQMSNLEEGRHLLKIKMLGPLGQLMDQRTLLLKANIPIYQTDYFLSILLLCVIVLLMSSFYLIYRNQEQAKAIKEKIAMDLHDETGTILTRLLMLNKTTGMQGEYSSKMNDGLNEVLFSLRAFLTSLRTKYLLVSELEDDLKDFVSLHLQGLGIQTEFQVQADKQIKLNGSLYRDIKLCVYEAVNNAIKHSGCDHIRLEISVLNQKLLLVIEDNGAFNTFALTNSSGNGLRNMEKRTMRNGGQVAFSNSRFGHGLRNEMTFKIT